MGYNSFAEPHYERPFQLLSGFRALFSKYSFHLDSLTAPLFEMKIGLQRPLALVILDGWGISTKTEGNAITAAHTPFYDQIGREFSNTSLVASGVRVGLPASTPGGPEIGHLNLGTGRVVISDSERISAAITSGSFANNEVLREAFARVSSERSSLHFVGLLSDTGVNSSLQSLFAMLRIAKAFKIEDVHIHCILDGRDSPPGTAEAFLSEVESQSQDIGTGRISSVCGRHFGMDTGGRWERTARAFTMLVHGEGERAADARSAVQAALERGISEEFHPPIIVDAEGAGNGSIAEGDTVVFFNHRPDGMRQLVRSVASAAPNTPSSERRKIEILCLTDYDSSLDVKVIFPQEEQRNVLTQAIAAAGIPNCRITESERTAHLTYFFDGGNYRGVADEREFHIPSPAPDKYQAAPELNSFKLADCARRELRNHSGMFIINLPAVDLLSQTGNFEKTVEAVQFVDTCLGGILETVRDVNGIALVTSSHGNCEEFGSSSANGHQLSRASMNPVPFHLVDPINENIPLRSDGALEDVAPTILGLLGIETPSEMTGVDLRK